MIKKMHSIRPATSTRSTIALSIKALACLALCSTALTVQGCGFQPVYATAKGSQLGAFQAIRLNAIQADPKVAQDLRDAFERRSAAAADLKKTHSLNINADEFAQRLAVQLDATVTRYNYILRANYTLREHATGKTITGNVQSVASFNVVDSQFSTLNAEQRVREKTARSLLESIERDILLTLRDTRQERKPREETPLPEFEFRSEDAALR